MKKQKDFKGFIFSFKYIILWKEEQGITNKQALPIYDILQMYLKHVYKNIYVCVHGCVYICMYLCLCKYEFIYVFIYKCAWKCICI
jgi:hypothetical protein